MGKLGQAAGGRATVASPSASPGKSWSFPEKECPLGVCMYMRKREPGGSGLTMGVWVCMSVWVCMQGLFECVMVDIQHSQYVVWGTPESKGV